jgi:hypothetical protein
MGWPDSDKTVVEHCATHWAELSEEERARISRERRASLLDGLLGVGLRLAMIGLAAFMAWYVWRSLGRPGST